MSARVIRVDFTKRPASAAPTEPATVHVLVPRNSAARAALAFDLYTEATTLDDAPTTRDRAVDLYLRALALDPTLATAYTNLGNIQHHRGDDAGAVALYRRALAVDPGQPEAHYNLGYLRLESGDARGAVPCFRAAIESAPTFADALYNLAESLEQLADHAAAVTYWKRYLEIEPTGPWAQQARQYIATKATRRRMATPTTSPTPTGSKPRLQGLDHWIERSPR